MFEDIILILDSTVRVSTPLLLACLAGLYSERSGIVDIGLEGKMLGAAFGAGAVAFLTANAWLGLLAGIGVSVGLALLHGFASISNRGNQIVSGVAINFLAAGLTALLGQTWFRQGGRTPALPEGGRFNELIWPFAEQIRSVPVLGPDLFRVVFRAQDPGLCRVSGCAADLVGAVQKPVRSAASGGR